MASNRFFLNDGSSTSEESSDDEPQVQVQTAKKSATKGGAKSYVSIFLKKLIFRFVVFSAPKPYLAISDDEEDVKRVVRSEKVKRYIY